MAISHCPKEESPKNKLLSKGAAALSDAELRAIFLRTGLPGITAIELGRSLLSEFGGIRPLLSARQAAFFGCKGLGPAMFTQLQAALELTTRYCKEELRAKPIFTSPKLVRDYLTVKMRGYRHEVFVLLLLDSRNQLLDFHELF